MDDNSIGNLIKLSDVNNENSVKSYALAICRAYLGGIWYEIERNQIEIERMKGGNTNYIYKVNIISTDLSRVNEPTCALLRVYGANRPATVTKDVVIASIMSNAKLGPKIYGIFDAGRLEEFIQSTSLTYSELHEKKHCIVVARMMAKIHLLDMPFVKGANWLFNTLDYYIKQSKEMKLKSETNLIKHDLLMSYDFQKESDMLKKILIKLDSPIVFCHNDIQAMNILKKKDDQLMIIDYEYGSYNYRGFDVGNYFAEWMFHNAYEHFPYFQYTFDLYPSREQQLDFVRSYMSEYNSTKEPKDQIKDEEKFLKEANYFALAAHLFWLNWSICQAEIVIAEFDFMEYALARSDAYFKQKNLILSNDVDTSLD